MIEPGQCHWLVNKPTDVSAGGLDVPGAWPVGLPTPEKTRSALARMQPGDPIACKSVTRLTRDLPFFTGDNLASVMTIHAVAR